MTFPKKNTRTTVVDEVQYHWHLNSNFDLKNSWIVVQPQNAKGQLLWIDPYDHEAQIGPGIVAEAIRFAIDKGWEPNEKAKPLRVAYTRQGFSVIPETSVGFEHLKGRGL